MLTPHRQANGVFFWRCEHGREQGTTGGTAPTQEWECPACQAILTRRKGINEVEATLDEIEEEVEDTLARNVPENESYLSGYAAGIKRAIRECRRLASE